MNTSSFNYLFGIDGNFTVKMEEMNRATGEFTAEVQKTQSWVDRIVGLAGKIDIFSNGIERTAEAFSAFGQGGIALNTSMTDLQAVTGVTGEGLRQIEGYARETAKAFGIDAAGAVESYKLILGQLSPELAKSPVALKAMGEHVATLSKLMGGDATAVGGKSPLNEEDWVSAQTQSLWLENRLMELHKADIASALSGKDA